MSAVEVVPEAEASRPISVKSGILMLFWGLFIAWTAFEALDNV